MPPDITFLPLVYCMQPGTLLPGFGRCSLLEERAAVLKILVVFLSSFSRKDPSKSAHVFGLVSLHQLHASGLRLPKLLAPGFSRKVLLESLFDPASLLLSDLPAVTSSQVNKHQSVIKQVVLYLPVQTGVCGEAGRMVDLNTQSMYCFMNPHYVDLDVIRLWLLRL